MRKFLLTIAVAAILVPGLFSAGICAHEQEPLGAYGRTIPLNALGKSAIGLDVVTVKKTSLPMETSVPGKIEAIPTRQFDQHAPLSGRITTVSVWPGEEVKQGQVLATIDSLEMNQLAAQLLQSKLDLESEYAKQKAALEEEVRQAEERLQLAEANRKRVEKLFSMKIAPEKDVLAADAEYQLAQTRIRTATKNREIVMKTLKARQALVLLPLRQRLNMLGVDEDQIAEMLTDQKTLTSVPVEAARSGVVTAITASPGKSIDPSVSLFTIADLSKVWATAEVYEDDMSRMKVGQPVHVKVHALAGEHVDGVLTYIGSQVDPQTRTLPVRAEIDNTDLRLKPDMYADLYVQTAESMPMIALPKDAIVEHGGHNIVFLEQKDGFQPSYVKLGRAIGDMMEVTEGLSVGQRVVVRGAFQLGAQLLKESGGEAAFSAPTEGERIDGEDEDKDKEKSGGLNVNVPTIAVIVGASFLLGFAISALFLFRGNKPTAAVASAGTEQAPRGAAAGTGTVTPVESRKSPSSREG